MPDRAWLRYFVVSDFCWSEDELGAGLLSLLEPEVEPLPAAPLLVDELGVDDEAPPPDWLFWSELVEDELEGEDVDGEAPMLDELDEPDGEVDGVEVAPLEDEPEGEEDGLVVDEDAPVAPPWLPPLSQAVSRVAPSAMETAIASFDSVIVASVVGIWGWSKLWAGRPAT